ncbi:KinB-signaling pathway activation protein [Bacillus sp. DJP31]|uniref:KinB-signaling pathway activation protein n=1 Tax=Bacillus sp. DJP31 TaxID=3409789 RepID=UPI003BB5ADAB
MRSRNWVRLFMSTLLVGGLSTTIIGLLFKWDEFGKTDMIEILSVSIWFFVLGLLFSIISQMGFFAYLTVHRFGLGIFRSLPLWNLVQIVLIVFVIFDLIFFREQLMGSSEKNTIPLLAFPFIILLFGLIIAYYKRKQTNKEAFIPALFFMVVVTVIEWVPAFKVDDESWLYLMLFPLMICNSYQLLLLHRLIKKS